MTARSDLFNALVEAFSATVDPGNPTHAIALDEETGIAVKFSAQPDGMEPEALADLVLVSQDAVRPGTTLGNTLQRQLSVIVVGRLTTPGPADDALEALLDEVLVVLDDADAVPFAAWVEAVRGSYLDAFPCYIITLAQEA